MNIKTNDVEIYTHSPFSACPSFVITVGTSWSRSEMRYAVLGYTERPLSPTLPLPPIHPRSPSLMHLHLPSSTAVRSTNRIMPCGSIMRSWPARPEWAPTTVPFLDCTARDGKATLNITPSLISLSHLLASSSSLCNFSLSALR